MKISYDKIEFGEKDVIFWKNVKTIRLLNDKLAFIMNDGSIKELDHVRATTIDLVFRSYENFLRGHPL